MISNREPHRPPHAKPVKEERDGLDVPVRSGSLQRRAAITARAAAMGIDEAYISTLVETFYTRIRADSELGPIFAKEVRDWDIHLQKMKAFWSSVALASGRYSGKPVPAHQKLDDVRPQHFARWLHIFRDVLTDTAPSPQAAMYFAQRAEAIARSLQFAMFVPADMPADFAATVEKRRKRVRSNA